MTRAHLVLADGTRFSGVAFGKVGDTVGEAVFTTGMTGYQEVLTDPSYCGQIVTMTAPQMGNTGVNAEDLEAARPYLAGFVVHELSPLASSWRATETLDAYLVRHGIVGIAGVDTRALTRHVRDHGAQMAAIGTSDPETLHRLAREAPPMEGRDLTGEVTCREPHAWREGNGVWTTHGARDAKHHVVAIDLGAKLNILRCLVDAGCRVTVVPARTTADEILALAPDGVFLSNGPGDPAAVHYAIETTRALLGKRPLFGICLGHQILGLAMGARTYKLKFGHRGGNHPVKDLSSGKIEITSQNHGFAIDPATVPGDVEVTHLNLYDGTVEGMRHRTKPVFCVQYHPEAAPGPHDADYLFAQFVRAMTQKA